MNERERDELTSRPNSSNLEREGDVFMPEPGQGESQQTSSQERALRKRASKLSGDQVRSAQERVSRGQAVTEDEKRAQEMLVEKRAMPIGGGSGDEPEERGDPAREGFLARVILEREMESKRLTNILREQFSDPELRKQLEEAHIALDDPEAMVKQYYDQAALELQTRQNIAERRMGKEPIYVPQSLEELAKLVMNRATPEYRRDGAKSLLNYTQDEQGKEIVQSVNTLNFLDWARQNYYLIHLNNPTTEVNFFSDIATNVKTEGIGGTISFYEITSTESYFLKETKDEYGNTVGVESDEYKALRLQMLYEVFLLQLQRNPAVNYVLQNRAEREKMLNAIAGATILNPVTRSDFAARIFTWPSVKAKSINDLDPGNKERELQAKLEGNFAMGNATRESMAVYLNIFDYNQLVKILGPDAPLFKYEYDKYDDWNAVIKKGETHKTAVDVKDPDKRKTKWFKDDGTLRYYAVETSGRHKGKYRKDASGEYVEDANGMPHPDYMTYLNIFLTPSPDQRQQDEIRERIRLSIMKSNGISFREAQIAELMAYSMTHINGVAARQDVDSVGFDWWTRVTNFREKRKREKSPKRNSPYGSEFNLNGYKRISLNIFEAVRDIRGRSLRSIVQGSSDPEKEGHGSEINIKGNALKDKVDFERDELRGGLIVFFDPSTGEKTTRVNASSYEIYEDIKQVEGKDIVETKIRFFDKRGNQLDANGLTPSFHERFQEGENKGNIIFIDKDKQEVDLGVWDYILDTSGKLVFRNKGGNIVEVGNNKAKTILAKVKNPLEFKQDMQKQYFPNHLLTGSEIYEWIMKKKELALPEIITGYDTHQNPIVNWEKINEIKGGIEHHFRYLLSTWAEINYAERNVEWEEIEVRNNDRKLLSKEGEVLDENWYVLDEKGRKTDRRADPETFLRSREMSRLESMFDADALIYIQAEIERRKLNGRKTDIIPVQDERTGKEVRVNITAASGSVKERDEFRLAVWQGAFEYLIAKEIEAHRTRGSGDEWYDANKVLRAKDALRVGQILEPEQIKFITKETDIGTVRVLRSDIGYAFATGGLEGVWKMFQIMYKDFLSGK